MSALGVAAAELAARGYYVLPLRPRDKRPITERGFKEATRDERQILRWWDATPEANIGIACGASGIVVFDIDSKAGADPEDVLAELDHDAPLVSTGEAPEPDEDHPDSLAGVRGGQLYFGGDLSGTDDLTIPGTEIRGRQHYVVAPPSVHPSGVEYAGELPPVEGLPPIPDWLREMCRNGNGRAAPPVEKIIPETRRNKTLTSLGGSMRRRGMEAAEIAAALKVTNQQRCRPPLDEPEVERIAASVSRYAPAEQTRSSGRGATALAPKYTLSYDAKNNLKLPPTPALGDVAGQCAWMTCVLALDREHPITGGSRQGVLGPEGHVELRRAGAPPIRFEPITRINAPTKLIETLSSRMIPTDGMVPAFKGPHCRQISHVIVMLCGAVETLTDAQETAGIVGTFMQGAVLAEDDNGDPIRVTTYGTSAQRYEAAITLRRSVDEASGRPIGPPRYAYDFNTGEILIAVSDLAEAARRHTGSSLPRGWLDARMSALGWKRVSLQGYGLPGREGREKGPHARINVYRGILASDEAVNT